MTTFINELVSRVNDDEESMVGLEGHYQKHPYNDPFYPESTIPIENSGAELNTIEHGLIVWDGTEHPEGTRTIDP